MLKISKLSIQNFGPYLGKHELSFSQSDGVTIVWGDNGFGKTTIMNAFRYVLWGTLYSRKRQILSPHTFVNNLSLESHGDMLIELYMKYNDFDCIVSRGLKRVSGNGTNAEDYEIIFNVKKGTTILNRDQSKEFLATAFPDRISRFYLFDGELLGEYEDLLDENDESGEKIKKSIEDILGIPILENAKKNIDIILGKFTKDASEAAKGKNSTEQLALQLEENNENLEHAKTSLKEMKSKLAEAKDEKENYNNMLDSNSLFSSYVRKRSEKEALLNKLRSDLEETRLQLGPFMSDAWRTIFNTTIEDAVDVLSERIRHIKEKESKANELSSISRYLIDALDKSPEQCPICESNLSQQLNKTICERFAKDFTPITEEERSLLDTTNSVIKTLNGYITDNIKGQITMLLNHIEKIQINIDITVAEIADINKNISAISTTTSDEMIQKIPSLLEKCYKKIASLEDGINTEEIKISDLRSAISKLSDIIEKNSNNPEYTLAHKRQQFVEALMHLFNDSISMFRDSIRESVEKDASKFFTTISNDPEYDHLLINNNYGLHIVSANGQIVPHRSSGYEQVVAISLISALHKNAPIEGPIFMDSTFQRVDEKHKRKIIKNLHTFGHQVIVLAYNGEMGNHEDVKELLGSHLLKEYKLVHNSSMDTRIE